jgi:F-type H+-transporting ATPase subunit delta
MVDYKVSLRYASSFLDSSIEKKNLESVSNDMELVFNTLESNKQLTIMLKSPVIKPEIKSLILNDIFKSKITEESLSFLLFVIEKKREDLLINIAKKFLALKDEYLGILNVEITTAFDFTEDQKERVKKEFETHLHKIIKLNFITDKNLIGGFVARAADTMYDASIKHQLEILRKQFLSGNVSLN